MTPKPKIKFVTGEKLLSLFVMAVIVVIPFFFDYILPVFGLIGENAHYIGHFFINLIQLKLVSALFISISIILSGIVLYYYRSSLSETSKKLDIALQVPELLLYTGTILLLAVFGIAFFYEGRLNSNVKVGILTDNSSSAYLETFNNHKGRLTDQYSTEILVVHESQPDVTRVAADLKRMRKHNYDLFIVDHTAISTVMSKKNLSSFLNPFTIYVFAMPVYRDILSKYSNVISLPSSLLDVSVHLISRIDPHEDSVYILASDTSVGYQSRKILKQLIKMYNSNIDPVMVSPSDLMPSSSRKTEKQSGPVLSADWTIPTSKINAIRSTMQNELIIYNRVSEKSNGIASSQIAIDLLVSFIEAGRPLSAQAAFDGFADFIYTKRLAIMREDGAIGLIPPVYP